jgi:prepilin-type N-terminal cleavage/methylation domain-containing protein
MKKAFSLVELMIVVAVIGILAAMAIPKVQNYSTEAKEAAAKENLQTLRATIELYASKHNGVPPGYASDDPTKFPMPVGVIARQQLLTNTHYIRTIPKNPFNGLATISCLGNNADFPANGGTGAYGYLYKPATKTIKLDAPGTDSKGMKYSDY